MTVYLEYAFLENFILDALLLFLALQCARVRCCFWKLFLASFIGAAEAILFPLVEFPVWAAYLVKLAGGAVIALIAAGKAGWRGHLAVLVFFYLMTFALGGFLVAAYSFFGARYIEAGGFLVESAPVALVLGCAGCFTVLMVFGAKRFYRYRRMKRNLFSCTLVCGKKRIRTAGLLDSGNLLTFRGEPVGVLSAVAALALFGGNAREAGRMELQTVNGKREAPVFSCELEIVRERGRRIRRQAFFTVGEVCSKEYQMILHSAFLEGEYETHSAIEKVARKNPLRRKRHSLSLRK